MHSPSKLKYIINNHFNFEVIELANSKLFMSRTFFGAGNPANQAFINMTLEHTLLHSRVLYEFYFRLKKVEEYNDSSYPRANMYIPKFEKPSFTDNIKDENEEQHELGFWKKVNNQILHLGINRTGNSIEKFNALQAIGITNDILNITKDFLNQLEQIENRFYFESNLDFIKDNIDEFISRKI